MTLEKAGGSIVASKLPLLDWSKEKIIKGKGLTIILLPLIISCFTFYTISWTEKGIVKYIVQDPGIPILESVIVCSIDVDSLYDREDKSDRSK